MALVNRWDIVTVGNLSRNRYWGESEDRPLRPTLCTSTLIVGEGFRLLVDPPIEDGPRMAQELNRRTGLTLPDVDLVFITHAHGDHYFGLVNFPEAKWLAAPGVAEAINAAGRYSKSVEPVTGLIAGAVEVVPTPGHTMDHHSLRFECSGWTGADGRPMRILVAGDAVMTRDFFLQRRGFFNSADLALAERTLAELPRLAEVIVPGHDNCFPVGGRQ